MYCIIHPFSFKWKKVTCGCCAGAKDKTKEKPNNFSANTHSDNYVIFDEPHLFKLFLVMFVIKCLNMGKFSKYAIEILLNYVKHCQDTYLKYMRKQCQQ